MHQDLEADYCVVGAGIAGLMVASRLARTGRKVLVLEQGPDVTEQDRADLLKKTRRSFNYLTDYNDHLGPETLTPTSVNPAMRLFGTGGTALHYGGWMVRPLEEDMKVRLRFGYGRDWPISFGDLEPWFCEAEEEAGVPGPREHPYAAPRSRDFPMHAHAYSWYEKEILAPALQEQGMQGHPSAFAVLSRDYQHGDYVERSQCAGHRFCKFCPTGARYSPDRVHGAWLRQKGVEIHNGVSLRRLKTSSDGRSIAEGQAVMVASGEEVTVKADQFVLAMGGVGTTRMLMLSGIGDPDGPLGKSYSDHLNSVAILELDRHVGSRLGFPTMQCDFGMSNVDRRQEPSWIMLSAPIGDDFLLQPHMDRVIPWFSSGDRIDLRRLRESLPRMVYLFMMHEMSGTGTMSLDPNEKDHFGDPVAKLELPQTAWEERAGPQFAEFVGKMKAQMGAVNSFILPPTCYYGHPSGTTAMGANATEGVCDQNLKVFGVDNLYLCSNSVFPHMAANPPTLTIAALALRLGAHLGGA